MPVIQNGFIFSGPQTFAFRSPGTCRLVHSMHLCSSAYCSLRTQKLSIRNVFAPRTFEQGGVNLPARYRLRLTCIHIHNRRCKAVLVHQICDFNCCRVHQISDLNKLGVHQSTDSNPFGVHYISDFKHFGFHLLSDLKIVGVHRISDLLPAQVYPYGSVRAGSSRN